MNEFNEGLSQMPQWVQIWVTWLMIINLSSILFIKKREAQITLIVFLLNAILMNILVATNGFNRLLGLSHVIFWTPLTFYLFKQSKVQTGIYKKWILILLITIIISLGFDYVDVIRYILGERS